MKAKRYVVGLFLFVISTLGFMVSAGPVDGQHRPLIRKQGTIDCDVVETSPVVFKGILYRCEWARDINWLRKGHLEGKPNGNHSRLIDVNSGKTVASFAYGHIFSIAFVDGGTIYVTAASRDQYDEGRRIEVFASKDLKHWDHWTALDLKGFKIYNTSVCKTPDGFVLMFEIRYPKEQAGAPFTARFATSKDMHHWKLTPPECVYAKDRYTAPHCLRYLDGYFYNFYLEAHHGYETQVVRSKDLIHWEPSPLNPVLKASPEDKRILNNKLTSRQRRHIDAAEDTNNSDIDFCEFNGRLVINYSWGNQRGVEFLAQAIYDGTEEDFLRGWFPNRNRKPKQ